MTVESTKPALPKYVEEDDVEKAAKARPYKPCDQLRYELKMCLLNTDCCAKEKRTPKDCLHNHDPSVPDECFTLAHRFFEYKISMLDARARFRGRKWDS